MLLNTGETPLKKLESWDIGLETFEVGHIEIDKNEQITKIILSDGRVLINGKEDKDIEYFDLKNIKVGDVVRLKSYKPDILGFSHIQEAIFAGTDTILSSSTEILKRIQRFSIGNLSFDEKYFREDLDVLMVRIDKITQLIGLFLCRKNKENIDEDILEKLINIGGEIEMLFSSAGISSENIVEKYINGKTRNILFIATIEKYIERGKIIKKLGKGILTEKEIEYFI